MFHTFITATRHSSTADPLKKVCFNQYGFDLNQFFLKSNALKASVPQIFYPQASLLDDAAGDLSLLQESVQRLCLGNICFSDM